MLPKKFCAFTPTLAILPVFTVPAGAATVIITKADCAALVRHVAEPGVAYEPGVDVNGRPVVPADLGDTPEIKLPERFLVDRNHLTGIILRRGPVLTFIGG